ASELEPLLRRPRAAGRAGADHEAVGRLQLLQAAFLADVAVVLLVTAVVLDQGLVAVAKRAGDRVGERLQQRAAQASAGLLDVFDGMVAHGLDLVAPAKPPA